MSAKTYKEKRELFLKKMEDSGLDKVPLPHNVKLLYTGDPVEAGAYACCQCGCPVYMSSGDKLPDCKEVSAAGCSWRDNQTP